MSFGILGLGTDTLGSIINPSSTASLFGLRPTQNRISLDGIIPLFAPQDTPGPITRTALDLAYALDAMVMFFLGNLTAQRFHLIFHRGCL